MTVEFLDIDVLVETHGGASRVRVIDSPAGQTTGQAFEPPFGELELENFLLRVGRPRSTRAINIPGATARSLKEAKAFGGRLLDALFPGPAMGCLVGSLARAQAQNKGLRIRLHLADSPQLAQYPWEFLYDANVDRFLCLSTHTPIVRYLELPEATGPLPVESPLRILVVISSPSDVPGLDVEREWSNLNTAMAGVVDRGLVKVDRLPKATMKQLATHLRTGRYHVLHFIGHGGFDESTGGVVVFEGADGRSHLVGADELGTNLHDHRSMGLVLLNSCEGGRGDATDPFAGTAQSLIRQGLGAVVAMQFEVTDEAAIAFSETFYESLSLGSPVDASVGEARKAVLSLPNPLEWATPVLYLRAPDGRIFDLKLGAGVLPAPPPPAPWWRRRLVPLVAAAVAVLGVVALFAIVGGGGGDDDGTADVTTTTTTTTTSATVVEPVVVTRTVRVEGNDVWTDTGVDLAGGDLVEITATGTVRHNQEPSSGVGPNGVGSTAQADLNTPGKGVYLFPPGHGGLIGRLGDGATPFGIGARWSDRVTAGGPLQLGVNDYNFGKVADAVANNSGAFDVQIRVTRG